MSLNSLNKLTASIILLLILGALPALAQQAPDDNEYLEGDYGRVSDARDGVTVLRSSWQEQTDVADDAGINSPIFPGDEVITEANQRAEIQLAGGSMVWVDERTKVEFTALPNPYSDVPDNAVLQLSEGSLRMSALIAADADFRIDTPAASVYPLDNAEFRVDVGSSGRTTVSSRRGVIEVAANGGSVLVRSGTRSFVSIGTLPNSPEPFHSFASDGLDRYADARDDLYRESERLAEGADAYRELPDEVRPYYRELSANGRWSYVDDYGYVWQPVGVAQDWRPYSAGYWGYGPHGYFWISNEPWGWAPYHYGRWSYINGFGWGWTAGSAFGGAWVSWSWGSAYVGWSPLNYWNYPAYRSVYHYGFYDPFCWNFVGYNHFYSRNYHHHHVNWDSVRHGVHRSAVVTRPPRISPRRLASSESARRSAVERTSASRSRIARNDGPRTSGASFRSEERRTVRTDRAAARSTITAPDGRSRQQPNLRSPARRSARSESPERVRGSSTRERIPVSSRQMKQDAATSDDRRRRPTAERNRSRSSGSGINSVSPRSKSESASSRVDGRMRDLFRRVSKPRQTKETPSSVRSPTPRSPSRVPTSRPRKPATRSTPRVTTPRVKPKSGATGRQEPSAATRGSRVNSPPPKSVRSGGQSRAGGASRTKSVSRPNRSSAGKSGGGRSRASGSRSSPGRRR